jgi:hypothetical protein
MHEESRGRADAFIVRDIQL